MQDLAEVLRTLEEVTRGYGMARCHGLPIMLEPVVMEPRPTRSGGEAV